MGRPLRIQYPGAIYHVTTLGNARQRVFLDGRDRRAFLNLLGTVVSEYNCVLYAYCLMGTHYHLLVETPDANVSGAMRQLNGLYTRRFNYRHERIGHIFQGRFESRLVEKGSYLLEASRYISLNPVRARMVARPEQYVWSSYRATAGYEAGPDWLSVGSVLDAVGGKTRQQRCFAYREFVHDGMGGQLSRGRAGELPLVWASVGFEQKMRRYARRSVDNREIPRRQRFIGRPALKVLFRGVRDNDRRDGTIWRAYKACGYSLTQIAGALGLSCSRVSRIVEEQRQKARPDTRVFAGGGGR